MAMAFTKKSVKLQDLGERLRSLREKLGLSPDDIRRVGKIQPKYLLALEAGAMQDLPATVYVKGFLRTLAQIYQVPVESLLEEFVAERQIRDNVEPPLSLPAGGLAPKSNLAIPRFVWNPRTITLAGVAVLGMASLGYLYWQISSLTRPPRIDLAVPIPQTINASLLTVAGKTERGASVFLNNQAIVVDASGNFSETLSLGSGSNILTIRAVNKFGQETTLTREVMYAQASAGSGSAPGTAIVVEVAIEARPAEIAIRSDGQEIFSGVIPAGARQTFTAAEKISLTTRDAGATRVSLNGKPLGVLGKAGETIENIEFTK